MYGDLLDKYGVVQNSVWKFDKGLLICGSNLDLNNQKYIPLVDCVYTNPPRNDTWINIFYKSANLKPEISFASFINQMFDLIKNKTETNSTVYFDVGIKKTQTIIEEIEKKGWYSKDIFVTYYEKRPKPCYTIVGSFWETPIVPSNLDGARRKEKNSLIIKDLIRAGHGKLFDPCCGSFDYLIEGLRDGMKMVYGIEIIPEKFALGLKRIENMGYKVERIK